MSKLNLEKLDSKKSKLANDISDAGATKAPAIVSLFMFPLMTIFVFIK